METATAPAPETQQTNATSATATSSSSPDAGSWRTSLPEEFRASPALAKFNDIPSLAKGYIEADKALLTPKLPMPQSNWTEKEFGDLYSKLGRPDKPEGYSFKPLENLPEGMKASPEQDKWFAEKAHKLGLSTAQASALREEFVGFQAQRAQTFADQSKAAQAERAAQVQKLESKYGSRWNAAIDGAQKVVSEFGSPEFKELLKTSKLDGHPAVMDFIVNIGSVLRDHSVITGIPHISGAFNSSPAAAQAEIAKMEADPETRKALLTASHPQHDAMVKKKSELMRAMVPVDK